MALPDDTGASPPGTPRDAQIPGAAGSFDWRSTPISEWPSTVKIRDLEATIKPEPTSNEETD